MSVLNFKALSKSIHNDYSGNKYGETPLPYAPKINLTYSFSAKNQHLNDMSSSNVDSINESCEEIIPQQYLDVNRSLESVENILAKISLPDDYLLFAGQHESVVFLQVGIIGYENYPDNIEQQKNKKIVYGRRWMLEPTTPTSEVVQTAYLAVKKAREHELREHVFFNTTRNISPNAPHNANSEKDILKTSQSHCTTPFNSHMDLPVMTVYQADFFTDSSDSKDIQRGADGVVDIDHLIEQVDVASYAVHLENSVTLSDDCVAYQLRLIKRRGTRIVFPELENKLISFVSEPIDNQFLHQFFAALLKVSDEYINEIFAFDGFKRFSQKVSIKQIAEFSFQTRNIQVQDTRFTAHFKDMSYRVDASKAPIINAGDLGHYQRQKISKFASLKGYLPQGFNHKP